MSAMTIESVQKAGCSIGGIQSIIFFEDNGFLQMPDVMHTFVLNPVNFINEAPIFSIVWRKSSASLRESKQTDNAAGDLYEYALSFFLPKNRQIVKKVMHRLDNRTVHAVCTDRNGFRTLLTDLRHRAEGDSGDGFATANGHNFVFYKSSPDIAPEYLPDVIDVPDGENCPDGLVNLTGAQLVDIDGDCLIQLAG